MKLKRPKSKQPIPKNAKRVFKGVMFDVYQWEQKQFDGTFKTFEKIKREDTVNIFPVTNSGKIILTKQEQPGIRPFIGAIGGRIDRNEDVLTAVRRELMEEAGLKAEKLILWHSFQPISKIEWSVYTFVAKGLEKVNDPNPDWGEKIKLVEYTFDEFINLVDKEKYRDFEVALKVLRAKGNQKKMAKLKKLFSTPNLFQNS